MVLLESRITDLLNRHVQAFPSKDAFVYLADGDSDEIRISYRELNNRVGSYARVVGELDVPGKCALLVFSNVLDFIYAFLACQQLGVICVPVFYSNSRRYNSRLKQLLKDSQAGYVFCCGNLLGQLESVLADLSAEHMPKLVHIETSASEYDHPDAAFMETRREPISFIQYTSGSTGDPKGVIVTHQNLLANQKQLESTFGCNTSSIILSWLPFQHDMGLIGNILHAIYVGCTCVLFTPAHFVQRPKRWLNAISKYNVTHSGGPNFAFDLCVEKILPNDMADLDLSSWKVAYNGSDFVKSGTLTRFSAHFKDAGFDPESFFPCYGLAEATLLVTGKKSAHLGSISFRKQSSEADQRQLPVTQLVSCGTVAEGMKLKIISIAGVECKEGEEGEICVAGPNVSKGYYRKDSSSDKILINGVSYFRTGDMGFLSDYNLYVSGRIKEVLVIRGSNVFPSDIEHHVVENVADLAQNGVAVFNSGGLYDEEIVLVAELKRTSVFIVNPEDCLARIARIAGAYLGMDLADIIITHPNTIPKTTSGKIQRLKCRDLYRTGDFNVLASLKLRSKLEESVDLTDHYLSNLLADPVPGNIKAYLINILSIKLGHSLGGNIADDTELTNLGLDSLRMVEVVNQINSELSISIDPHKIYLTNKLGTLIGLIDNMFWIKNSNVLGPEIDL